MSHRSLATWLLLLSLGIVGVQACGSGEDAATTEEDPATTEEVVENGESVPVEPFSAEPTAPETEPRTTAAPAGLINSTNSDERAQEVQSRINNAPQNPFDVLPVELVETLEPPEEEETVAVSPQTTGGGGGGTTTATQTTGGGGGGTTTATQTTGGGGGTTATQTTGGGGGGGTTATSGGAGQQPAVSLPPLPATVAQVAEPLPTQPTLFVPPNDNAIAQLSPAELGISEPEGESTASDTPSGVPSGTPSSTPSGTPASTPNGESIAQAEPGAASGKEPGETTEEAPLSLPPLQGQPIAELPPLPTEIGPAIPPPPPVPPTISENVQVTGVVEVGGDVQVIVQLPGSSSGRYVRVGDVIAGGRVLVKRVDGIQSTNPIVILEEDGSEYPRFLGEPPTIAMEEDSGLG